MSHFLINSFSIAVFIPLLKNTILGGLLLLSYLETPDALANNLQVKDLQKYQTELRPNESLKQCLQRLNISDPDIYKVLSQSEINSKIALLPVNTPIKLKVDTAGKVQSLKIPLVVATSAKSSLSESKNSSSSEVTVLVFVRPHENSGTLKAMHLSEKTQVRVISKSGEFDGNFFNVMDRQEIPDSVSEQFVRIFSSSVNFSQDLRHQATFTMKYEVVYLDDSPISTGKVLHGAINTTRNQFQAFWWKPEGELGNYYSPSGDMLSSLPWKTPIAYSRKTSNFGMRIDPFTGNWANHQGVDISAPTGTEVRATQHGTVKSLGNQGHYGNVVVIEHANGYETVYGHLSGFAKLSPHQLVPQGTLLGYVGSTGRSTGPHLHYELRKYGQAINPEQNFRSLSSNYQAQQLNGEELKQFVKFQNSLLTSKLASR